VAVVTTDFDVVDVGTIAEVVVAIEVVEVVDAIEVVEVLVVAAELQEASTKIVTMKTLNTPQITPLFIYSSFFTRKSLEV
jgi:hypothetical protein